LNRWIGRGEDNVLVMRAEPGTAKGREDLLKAAGELLRRTGFQDTSMADIAAHMGVPRSSLYYHFGGKGDLLAEILLSGSEEAFRKVADIADYPISPPERLKLAVRALLIHNIENPSANVATVYHVDSPLLTKEQRERIVDSRDRIDRTFRRILQEGVEEGWLKPLNLVVVANAILSSIGRFQSWFRSDGDLSVEEVVAAYSELFLNGTLRHEGEPGK
jgi:AcrR family transcriptional regulator